MSRIVYKICPHSLWQNAEKDGVFTGAPVDHADGFIHFSTAEQVQQTAKLHFGGATDLVLLAVDSSKLGSGLVYEKSRGGALFPHLYGAFNFDAVCWVKPLPLAVNGIHEFPDLSA